MADGTEYSRDTIAWKDKTDGVGNPARTMSVDRHRDAKELKRRVTERKKAQAPPSSAIPTRTKISEGEKSEWQKNRDMCNLRMHLGSKSMEDTRALRTAELGLADTAHHLTLTGAAQQRVMRNKEFQKMVEQNSVEATERKEYERALREKEKWRLAQARRKKEAQEKADREEAEEKRQLNIRVLESDDGQHALQVSFPDSDFCRRYTAVASKSAAAAAAAAKQPGFLSPTKTMQSRLKDRTDRMKTHEQLKGALRSR